MSLIPFLFASFAAPAAAPVPELQIARGAPVTLDGRIDDVEWRDAATLSIGGGYRLHAKLAGDNVLIALRYPEPTFVGVDLYVDTPNGSLLNMHASAQIGQRHPQGDQWTPWNWGNNAGWDSHVTERTPDRTSFVRQQGREFRISRALLAGPAFRLRIALNDERTLIWPAGTAQRGTSGWARLSLPSS